MRAKALLAFRIPRLRRLQDDLPDVTPEDRLPQAAPGASVPVGVTESAPALTLTGGTVPLHSPAAVDFIGAYSGPPAV